MIESKWIDIAIAGEVLIGREAESKVDKCIRSIVDWIGNEITQKQRPTEITEIKETRAREVKEMVPVYKNMHVCP
ncbi:MAG: hypothetical protein QRY16_20355 [Enterobacterales bacterium endosymbiont of Blomia tropicalis]|nr:hypothetical protein [Mixta mediterraneensis]MDL4916027.1 hypothetical protein [Mixta mediterraneensis]